MKGPSPRGRGSNQYVDRPGSAPIGSLAARRAARQGVLNEDPEIEAIEWAFTAESEAWASDGFPTWADVEPWHRAGFVPMEAFQWSRDGHTSEDAAKWAEMFSPRMTGLAAANQWKRRGFSPDTAAPWVAAGFGVSVEAAVDAQHRGWDVDTAVAEWTAVGLPSLDHGVFVFDGDIDKARRAHQELSSAGSSGQDDFEQRMIEWGSQNRGEPSSRVAW